MPDRLRRSRARGYRMPAGAIYVGRPTRWGNPFSATDWRAAFRALACGCRGDRAGMQEASVRLYRLWLAGEGWPGALQDRELLGFYREVVTKQAPLPPPAGEIREALRGRDLVCWCPLEMPCHADVLLEVANADARSA